MTGCVANHNMNKFTIAQLRTLAEALLLPAPSPTKKLLDAAKAARQWFTKPIT